jgi:hypothetical protein
VKRQDAEAAGYRAGAALSPLGRAARVACGAGGAPSLDHELFRLPAADEAVALRLLKLGEANVGGFIDGGIDGEGVWLVRLTSGAVLSEKLRERKGPWPFREALSIGLAIARALAACERSSLFPGPLTPDAVRVLPPAEEGARAGAFLPAAALVGALLGARDAGSTRDASGLSPLWTPPPQADGAAWDSAANRYALGLILYRLLAGEHPFAGAGLRHALGEAAHREAAPFASKVASALPSGLQSLTLRLLDPVARERPETAAAIAGDLEAFLEPKAPSSPALPLSRERGRASLPERQSPPLRSGRGGREARSQEPRHRAAPALRRLWPIGVGAAVALGALSLLAPAREKPVPVAIAEQAPITAATTAATDCAACHARQTAEWRRSVMAHAVKSPLFNALESLIEEQVGRDDGCPNGAGVLRRVDARTACRDPQSGLPVTGSGGEHWCVNCHSPTEKLDAPLPPWEGKASGSPQSRRPVRDLLGDRAMEGISCGFCHEVHGPVGARGARGYQGNPTWTSFLTGQTFAARPEDARGLTGIGNSGYDLRPEDFLLGAQKRDAVPDPSSPIVHRRPPAATKAYLRSSEFCGSCHDVRLFGTDALGRGGGEHFKRLRNAYSEWAIWAKDEARRGRTAATCQDCHMSSFPGTCVVNADGKDAGVEDPECPKGSHFVARAPGERPKGRVADNSAALTDVTTHYFSGVDVPLSREFPSELIDEPTVDLHGVPLSARRRRDLLLRHTFRFGLGAATRSSLGLSIPVEIENIGAGHRVPAGFSQEREFWVHLVVRDGDGRALYEVGRVDRNDEDLRDKVFARVNVRGDALDGKGRPLGVFGADVRDGPDVPAWQPSPLLGGTSFRGKGLVNFQNGFLRCVRCIGTIGPDGRCEALPGQEANRADRFADGDYDLDTGECRSNLSGAAAFLETYFPVGALDASRGLAKGPDAIIDTRSLPPGVPIRYTYELGTSERRGPFRIEARLLFRAFPPFLVRGFADYEREQTRRGLRPSGPLVTDDMLARLEVVELSRATAEVR